MSLAAVAVPGRGEYGNVHLGDACSVDDSERTFERTLVLAREADDHVRREVEVGEALEPPQERRGVVAPAPSSGGRVVSRLERNVRRATVGVSRIAASSSALTWLTSSDDRRRRASPGTAPASRTSRASE